MGNAMPVSRPAKIPNYGTDAPGVMIWMFVIGGAGVALAVGSLLAERFHGLAWARFLVVPFAAMGFGFLVSGSAMVWGSKYGKLGLRDKVIGSMAWRGDEQVLDVGCGHGLMLIAAANRLDKGGRAVGVDLWRTEDQAGNSMEATQENVVIEGVAQRVELRNGDARRLEFPADSFDVVVSSWALHNIYDADGRAQAIREIARVLRPGGRVAIVDIRHTREYREVLKGEGFADVQRRGPNFLFFIPTFTLMGRKPDRS